MARNRFSEGLGELGDDRSTHGYETASEATSDSGGLQTGVDGGLAWGPAVFVLPLMLKALAGPWFGQPRCGSM